MLGDALQCKRPSIDDDQHDGRAGRCHGLDERGLDPRESDLRPVAAFAGGVAVLGVAAKHGQAA